MANIIDTIFNLLTLLILARVLMSWFRPDPYNPIVRTIIDLTDPIMEPVRRLIPPVGGMDFSPIIVLIGLSFLQRIILSLVRG